MPLERLSLTPKNITKGIEIVRGMKTIVQITAHGDSSMTPKDFWKKYDAGESK